MFSSIWFFLLLFISSILMLTTYMLSSKLREDREFLTPFECGFDPTSNNRLPFSMRFFSISIIFLIFDIEIALLMPPSALQTMTISTSWALSYLILLLFLWIGTIYEWGEFTLKWKF